MSNITGLTGVMPKECNICGDNADWEFTRNGDYSFFICSNCCRIIVRLICSQYPEEIDLSYIWFLRTSKAMEKNEESENIQDMIVRGLEKFDKYKETKSQGEKDG